MVLEFVENNDKIKRLYPVDFTFNSVKYIVRERFVIEGYLDMLTLIYHYENKDMIYPVCQSIVYG